ncbi:hypothetical protein [Tissierella simiarum]|nr:hypothetical protein [Tissierella simiarum]
MEHIDCSAVILTNLISEMYKAYEKNLHEPTKELYKALWEEIE